MIFTLEVPNFPTFTNEPGNFSEIVLHTVYLFKEYFDHNPICLNNWEPPLLTIIITLYWKVAKPSKHSTCNATRHSLWLLGFSVVFHFAFYNFSDSFHLIRIVIFCRDHDIREIFFCRWIHLISEGIKTWKKCLIIKGLKNRKNFKNYVIVTFFKKDF